MLVDVPRDIDHKSSKLLLDAGLAAVVGAGAPRVLERVAAVDDGVMIGDV